MTATGKRTGAILNDGPGLHVLSTEQWYGPGYCGVCGTRDESEIVPRHVRYWDCDDGWRSGVLCITCAEYAAERGPREGDYAYALTGRDAAEAGGERIDALAELGDQDAAYTGAQDAAPALPAGDAPAPTDAPAVLTIKASALLAALDQCLVVVAREDSRPVLTGININVTADGATFAAADGFRLVVVRAPMAGAAPWTAILDGAACKAALPAIKATIKADRYAAGGAMCTLTLDGRRIMLGAGAATIALPTIDGSFPHYDKLIPAAKPEGGSKIAFNPAYLGSLLVKIDAYASRPRDSAAIVRMFTTAPDQPMLRALIACEHVAGALIVAGEWTEGAIRACRHGQMPAETVVVVGLDGRQMPYVLDVAPLPTEAEIEAAIAALIGEPVKPPRTARKCPHGCDACLALEAAASVR